MAQDTTYKQGAFIKVAGTIGLMSAVSGQVGATLKVLVHDVEPRTMSFTPSAPVSAYYIGELATGQEGEAGFRFRISAKLGPVQGGRGQ